jgi:hypothetical protein
MSSGAETGELKKALEHPLLYNLSSLTHFTFWQSP